MKNFNDGRGWAMTEIPINIYKFFTRFFIALKISTLIL